MAGECFLKKQVGACGLRFLCFFWITSAGPLDFQVVLDHKGLDD
jgi:hypothetical protein